MREKTLLLFSHRTCLRRNRKTNLSMLIIHFWKQGWCSGFDWAHASREYHDPGSNPAVDAICELVVGCLPHSESFFFFFQKSTLSNTVWSETHGHDLIPCQGSTAQGIRNPTNDWNPESKFRWNRIRNPRRETRVIPSHAGRTIKRVLKNPIVFHGKKKTRNFPRLLPFKIPKLMIHKRGHPSMNLWRKIYHISFFKVVTNFLVSNNNRGAFVYSTHDIGCNQLITLLEGERCPLRSPKVYIVRKQEHVLPDVNLPSFLTSVSIYTMNTHLKFFSLTGMMLESLRLEDADDIWV